jgi:hypothetical protein
LSRIDLVVQVVEEDARKVAKSQGLCLGGMRKLMFANRVLLTIGSLLEFPREHRLRFVFAPLRFIPFVSPCVEH